MINIAINDTIADINEKIQRLCNSNGVSYIGNNRRGGSSHLPNNFKKLVSSLWKSGPLAEVS